MSISDDDSLMIAPYSYVGFGGGGAGYIVPGYSSGGTTTSLCKLHIHFEVIAHHI